MANLLRDKETGEFFHNPTALLIVFAAVGLIASIWSFTDVTRHSTRMAAVQDADLLFKSIITLRSFHSDPLAGQDPEAGKHDLLGETNSGANSNPDSTFALSHEFHRRLEKSLGSRVIFYDPYPSDGKSQEEVFPDSFTRRAWDQAQKHTSQPITQFEERDGKPILRYANADVMTEQCVGCHNSHPESGKKNWKVGDARGIVEIQIPLSEGLVVNTQADIQQGLVFFAFLSFLWFGVAGAALVSEKRAGKRSVQQLKLYRSANAELRKAKEKRESAESERRRLETQIQEAQKLESLSVMTAGLAHDLNNMLVPVLANADLLRSEVPLRSSGREMVEDILLAAGRGADLCRQMLAYAGKAKLEHEQINLNQSIQETAQILTVNTSKHCELILDLNEDDLLMIEADPIQIEQIMLNLITNASESIGESAGTIRISTGRTFMGEGQNVPAVYFEVLDDGPGISEEAIAKIFDPFYSTKFAGRGLGLAAVQGIVRAHEGSVSVVSEVGEFACIRITLPELSNFVSVRTPARAQKSALVPWTGGKTILLADDEEAILSVAKRMIEGIGLNAITASNGEEAVRLFSQAPDRFSGCVLDLTMPKLDGLEALQRIRTIRPEVPCILVSGFSDKVLSIEDFEDERTAFLSKPYRARGLQGLLRAIAGVTPDSPPQSQPAARKESSESARILPAAPGAFSPQP